MLTIVNKTDGCSGATCRLVESQSMVDVRDGVLHEAVYSGGAEPGIGDRGVMNLCPLLCRVDVFKRAAMSRRFRCFLSR